ncbi:hypothetical protein DYB37_008047 [Aphanomyces astaci]|uniref:CCHC-type domain-containing protein n=1 Tax=Aphanomyces astaci TaxID=112090 RepID=A0A418E465_APHAT|nr:hypothetical protein DYB37_008047 [Aphanomyces astaci]
MQKTLSRKMAEITDKSHRKSTETVPEYAWRIADASREAGLQANRAVVMMINGCSDAEVAACLRGASVRPETIEISLDYLIERDVDIDRRTDGNNPVQPRICMDPDDETKSGEVICVMCTMRGHSREQCPRLSWFCTMCRSKGLELSECSLSLDNGGRGPGQTRTGPGGRGGNSTCYTCGKMGHLSSGCPVNASKQCSMLAHVVAALQSWYMLDNKQSTEDSPDSDKQ